MSEAESHLSCGEGLLAEGERECWDMYWHAVEGKVYSQSNYREEVG